MCPTPQLLGLQDVHPSRGAGPVPEVALVFHGLPVSISFVQLCTEGAETHLRLPARKAQTGRLQALCGHLIHQGPLPKAPLADGPQTALRCRPPADGQDRPDRGSFDRAT